MAQANLKRRLAAIMSANMDTRFAVLFIPEFYTQITRIDG